MYKPRRFLDHIYDANLPEKILIQLSDSIGKFDVLINKTFNNLINLSKLNFKI